MFVKIFESLFSSTIVEAPLHIRWVWIAMLTIPKDDDGIVDMTPAAIARYANVTTEEVTQAIDFLCQPDSLSRSDAEEGRRLVPIRDTYGWRIVNFQRYRQMRTASDRRQYMRDYMRERRSEEDEPVNSGKQPVSRGKQRLGRLAEAEGVSNKQQAEAKTLLGRPCGDVFEERWSKYPKKDGKKEARRHFNATIKNDEDLARFDRALNNYIAKIAAEKTEAKFVKNGSTFFNNWADYETWEPPPSSRRQTVTDNQQPIRGPYDEYCPPDE